MASWFRSSPNKSPQMQAQKQVSKQSQIKETVSKQMLIEAVSIAFKSVVLAANMANDPSASRGIVDSLSDGAVFALDAFSVTVKKYIEAKDKDSIALAQKELTDLSEDLRKKQPETYELTQKHRALMFAALDGQQGLYYGAERADPKKPKLFEQSDEAISNAYGHAIKGTHYVEHLEQKWANEATNAELRARHDKQLEQFKDKKKYGRSADKQYVKPNVGDLYFTDKAKGSKFTRLAQDDDNKADLDDELNPMGVGEGAYAALAKLDLPYPMNAAIKVLKGDRQGVTGMLPCHIDYPKKNRAKLNAIRVHLAQPHGNRTLSVAVERLIVDPDVVTVLEAKWIKKKGKLGYKSIEEIADSAMDVEL